MLNKGSIVSFGKFKQNKFNDATDIQWIVLDTSPNRALLLSRFVLDAKHFHSTYGECTWEKSQIREYLNDSFYVNSFSEQEKQLILPVRLDNSDDEETILFCLEKDPIYPNLINRIEVPHQIESANTVDRVFLLSTTEFKKYKNLIKSRDSMRPLPTDYALSSGLETIPCYCINGNGLLDRTKFVPYCNSWLLRNRKKLADSSACVMSENISEFPVFFHETVLNGIRPAIWVSIGETDILRQIYCETERIIDALRCHTIDDLHKMLRQIDLCKVSIMGKRNVLHYSTEFGDERVYYDNYSFISYCEIEKFFDCYPVASPSTIQELKKIYFMTPKIGTMLTCELIPQFDADLLFTFYAIANTILYKNV